MAKAIAVTKLGVVGGTVYNVGNYVLDAAIADAVVAAGLATVTQADVADDIDLATPEALLNAMGDTPSLVIVSASVTTKPVAPNEKDVYIVPAGSAWAALAEAYDNQLALFERGGWQYITPKFGWQVRNKADNGVLWFDGDSWEVSGSGGGGSGTVTSVGLSLPNIFTISGSPVTTSGTLSATLANQSANQIFAGPTSGGAATPGFRSLVAADIPDISSVYATKAYADGLVVGLLDDRGNFDASSNTFPAAGGSGSAGAVLKGDLWTISVAGTLGGTSVTPGDIVRALTDAPGQTASNWAVSETNIGYAALNAALSSGQIYVGNSSNVGTARTLSGDVTINNTGVTAIGNAKVTNAMLAGSIDLTAKVTGVLPVANGGTGLSALGSALQVLRVNGGGTALEFAAAAGGGITIGSTTITSGVNTKVLFNNSGVVGEYSITGTGNVVMNTSPTITTPAITTSAIVTRDGLGTTNATGIELINNTQAGVGAQQISPDLVQTAQGWKTNTTAASQTVNFRHYVLPVQGAASPAVNWVLQSQVNGGGYTTRMTVTSGGQILSGGDGSASSPAFANGNNTNTGIYFPGGNQVQIVAAGTDRAVFSGSDLYMSSANPTIRDNTDTSASSITLTTRGKGGFALNGSPVYIKGGAAGTSGNRDGGDVFLIGGAKGNSGNDGNVYLGYDGSVARGFVFVGATQKLTWGSGSPESVVTAPVGSMFLRSDGGSATTLYIKESGSGNTGWVGK